MLMKKLFTLFAAAILAVSAYAQDEVPQIPAVMGQETQNPGKAIIMWQGDSTLSKVYLVYLYAADMETQTVTPIAYAAAKASYLAVPGYPGYYYLQSADILQYGQSYMTLKDNPQVPPATLAQFQAGWENNVDATDYTLKGGSYYTVVTGYDATGATVTETKNGAVFQLEGKTEGFENIFESKKPVKYMTPEGEVRIFRDGKIFNMSGALVQ